MTPQRFVRAYEWYRRARDGTAPLERFVGAWVAVNVIVSTKHGDTRDCIEAYAAMVRDGDAIAERLRGAYDARCALIHRGNWFPTAEYANSLVADAGTLLAHAFTTVEAVS